MSGSPQPGWIQAKDGSWHPYRLVDVRCPHCGLEGGAPVDTEGTSCPNCGANFALPPEPVPTPVARPSTSSTAPSWAATLTAVVIAATVVVIGVAHGRPGPEQDYAWMNFCTSGSAPTVSITMTVGGTNTSTVPSVPNGHCAVKARFKAGATLVVQVRNPTGVGEVGCVIVRNGRRIDTDQSTLLTKPATCRGRA